jgi:predicted transposase YdaD
MALTDVLIERDKQTKLEARTTIARTMLQKQMSVADIAEITGLSIEQVQQLQTQN